MTKTAWVFPGQGSQAIGMGLDLLDTEIGKQRFEAAASILGWSVPEVCGEDETRLSQTNYTQPCLYVVSAIFADLLTEKGLKPDLVAGHSLGEYVALYSAQVFDFESGLKLVQKRSTLMSQASDGKMAALMGFDRDQLSQTVESTDGVVLANDNHAGQVVISGTPAAVDSVLGSIKVKRAVELNVSGAFHSPLMADAAAEYESVLNSIDFKPAQVPVVSNVEPTPSTDPATLQTRLIQQMTGPVRWRETALVFADQGIESVLEVGPGKVLTGLVKRTCKEMALTNINSLESLPA
ncbi:ACP S-malonyltransferase [Acaryochloris sp. CCMEE 5410]|uniref:ACP S-malonyltransferase n=1 Tax=Acaryochloris sp. CCMEE 5410 TaxID=310037 RepID=UPI00024846C9|nr:ACP S-malonyltransferase [Acaryochloris sp. CCMEE 5410]KAI9135146.1 ACP S-malonyltransferase [Acaryochloris sp. CCMEE 5410]